MTFFVPVFYATTEGQTRKIAEYLAAGLRMRGVESAALEVRSEAARTIDWSAVRGAVVGASVHIGKHQKEALEFVRQHREQLNERPSAFYSVSLAAASSNANEVEAVRKIANDFIEATQWYADHVLCIAGGIAYTKYGFLKRLVMRRIAAKEGGSTDTSRDHEYTDWTAVDRLADLMAQHVETHDRHAVPA